MTIRKKALGLTAVAVAAALALAGCSSTGGAAANSTTAAPASGSGAAASGGGAVASTPNYTIAMITHETPGDTFWDKIRSGAEAAAAKDNINLKYSNDPVAANQATLIQNAVDSKVDGIATTLVTPDALSGAVQTAIAAKIPVVGFNSGIDAWKQLGALEYFGSDENLAGNAVGDRQDPSIDYVVTLGAPIALAAVQAASDAKSSAKVVTFDLNADVAAAIKAGTVIFSVDQQPYLQATRLLTPCGST
jgi:simple sugar transport system substrate-binding protein